MDGWDKHVVLILDHAHRETLGERLCCRMEEAYYCVAESPAHEADRVCVNARHEEGHGSAVPH